jgi:hypothetical protein
MFVNPKSLYNPRSFAVLCKNRQFSSVPSAPSSTASLPPFPAQIRNNNFLPQRWSSQNKMLAEALMPTKFGIDMKGKS